MVRHMKLFDGLQSRRRLTQYVSDNSFYGIEFFFVGLCGQANGLKAAINVSLDTFNGNTYNR